MTAILDPRTTTEPAGPAPAPVLPAVPPPAGVPADVAPADVAPVPGRPAGPRAVLSARGVRLYAAAVLGLVLLGDSVQPVTDGPNPTRPLWADVLLTAAQVGLLAMLAGAVLRRRWAVWAGLVTGSSLLALSLSCPVTGHHVYAAWWGVQLAAGLAMTGLSAVLLRRTRAS